MRRRLKRFINYFQKLVLLFIIHFREQEETCIALNYSVPVEQDFIKHLNITYFGNDLVPLRLSLWFCLMYISVLQAASKATFLSKTLCLL